MEKVSQCKPNARCTMCALCVVVLTACGGSGGGESEPQNQLLLDTSVQASGGASIAADPGTPPEFTPSPGNGLPSLYQDPGQDQLSSDENISEYIDVQWQHMQTCLLVSAQEPLVVVVGGKLTPKDSNDDVVRHIDGQIKASVNVTDTSTTIQVSAQDFDGSLGSKGAYLRSIMGRYLWLANSLAERDYPYDCARGE